MNNSLKTYLNFLEEYNNSIVYFIEKADSFKSDFQKIKKDYRDKLSKYQGNKNLSLQNLQANFEKEINALDEKKKKLIGEINRYKLIFEEGSTKYGKITPEIAKRIEELKEAVLELDDLKSAKVITSHSENLKNLDLQFSKIFGQLEKSFEDDSDNMLNDARIFFENHLSNFNVELNKFNPTKDLELINEDISTFSSINFLPITEIGTFSKVIEINGTKILKEIKVVIPFIDSKSILIIHNNDTIDQLNKIHDTIITRSLVSSEVGKIKLVLSDLKDLGVIFREYVPLSHESVSVANGKSNFEKTLIECEERLQEVSIKYTSSSKHSNFTSLGEYNYHKIQTKQIEDIIPQYISVVLNLSYEADESMLRKLNRLNSNGINNGTQFLMSWNIDDNSSDLINQLIGNKDVVTIDLVGDKSNYLNVEHNFNPNQINESKIHEFIDSYNHHFKEIVNKVIKENFQNALPLKENWFQLDSSDLVSIPVGKSKQHRGEQNIEIKTNDLQAHVMLSGGTGSGKTNFLKTFITSASLNYSSESLEFYLIDLKNGIGFDIFRRLKLPHVKMFAMGAENELILNLLDSLVDEMNNRLNLFTLKGVDDISKYNKQFPNQKIKRTILVVDEFATIFEEDAPYQDEICARLAPLAKKARAAGINLFFSTQNFNHVSHSFSKLKTEIPIRIVLKSSLDAATALLDSRNDAMKLVNTVGDGVINYRLGVKLEEKDNEFFKAYLLENEDLEKILIDLKNQSDSLGFKENDLVVYDNLAEAKFEENNEITKQNRVIEIVDEGNKKTYKPTTYKKIPIWLGEPTIISANHFKIELERNFNENILLAGIYKDVSINALYNIFNSLICAFAPGEIAIRIFSFLDNEENTELNFPLLDRISNYFDYKFIENSDFKSELEAINQELIERQRTNNIHSKRVFNFFIGLEKARELYKEDSYSTSKYGDIVKNILENGNAFNFHTICEMRVPSVLNKILNSNAINLFKHRIVFHLGNSDESLFVLENRMAGTLYKKDEPHSLNRGIYYNADFEGSYHKFKPYLNLVNNDLFYPSDIDLYSDFFEIEVIKSKNEDSKGIENENDNSEIQLNKNQESSENNDINLLALNKIKDELESLADDDEIIDIDDF